MYIYIYTFPNQLVIVVLSQLSYLGGPLYMSPVGGMKYQHHGGVGNDDMPPKQSNSWG